MKPHTFHILLAAFAMAVSTFIGLSAQETGDESGFDDNAQEDGSAIQIDTLEIDPSILGVARVNPDNPDIPVVNNQYSVGTPSGSFSVNDAGAAVYSLSIDCPDGKGLTPQISLAYSSQNAGYGEAGYGFSISGLSAITRGGKTPFNNGGVAGGVTYGADDCLFLDGKRLILLSGSALLDGAVYCLEGDPHTRITVHDSTEESLTVSWFEVQTPEGMKYEYGRTGTSRLTFTASNAYHRAASWHLNRSEDVYGNYATYSYSIADYHVYPTSITYGENSVKSRGVSNRIVFGYENNEGSPSLFNIDNKKGSMSRRLSNISTYSGTSLYRKYYFTYDSASDGTTLKFDRLTSIREENGDGESLTPVNFQWNPLPAANIARSYLNIPTDDGSSLVETQDRSFFAADMNGDGISDIIRVSPVKVKVYDAYGNTSFKNYTRVYISCSSVSSDGVISYLSPLRYEMSGSYDNGIDVTNILGGSALLDYDGDGFNDLVLPIFENFFGEHFVSFKVISGKSTTGTDREIIPLFECKLEASDKLPLFVSFDANKDGKDEIIFVEQKKLDNRYPAFSIFELGKRNQIHTFSIGLPMEPKKLFSGDYNNDGLTDIILLYDGGYKIYFNNGGSDGSKLFTESNTKTGTSIGDGWRVAQGDFDGDGLVDFLHYKSRDTFFTIARNNGDGTFTCCRSDDIGVGDSSADYDNESFSISVYDIDGDGRCDAQVCKREANDMHSIWLYSDGQTLKFSQRLKRTRKEDAKEGTVFVGDFDGDGSMELANYGGNLLIASDTFAENRINVYRGTPRSSSAGRITAVTDGMANRTSVEYEYLTSPSVYSRTANASDSYPFNTYTLPVSVVKSITSTNGSAGEQTTDYFYKDLRIHIAGGGVTGFDEVATTDRTTGRKTTRRITKWDKTRLVPLETVSTDSVGEHTSSVVTSFTAAAVGKTYFTYESGSVITDMDGHTAVTSNKYDTAKGVLLEQTVSNDGENMYKKSVYSGYQQKSGRWLPTSLVLSQKHKDDSSAFSTETKYTYDAKGSILTTVANYGTDMALTTIRTYDTYGNCLTSLTKGTNVKEITTHNQYDTTGRYVVKTYTTPASTVATFTYDMWGNVLTSSDETEPTNVLTTSYSYNGWGRRIRSAAPDSTVVTSEIGWGKDNKNKYYTLTRTSNRPWVITWYDNAGHEMSQKTFGPANVLVSKTTTYNNRGLVSTVYTVDGKIRNTEKLTYDDLGRVVSSKNSSGKVSTYSYGDRSVTTNSSGRVSTVVHDAWGNTASTIDHLGKRVWYAYRSNGKPGHVTTDASTVNMEYDAAGNQTLLADPDAGLHRYEYAADGTLLKHTDPKNVITTYTYDELGRLSKTQTGSYTITNTYGTSGVEKMKLTKQTMGANSVEYKHDKLGRIVKVRKNINGHGVFDFYNVYDNLNRLSSTIYPGNMATKHSYDDYGFRIRTVANGMEVFLLKDYEGGSSGSFTFMDSITAVKEIDSYGYVTGMSLSRGAKVLDRMDFEFDKSKDNLLARQRKGDFKYYFDYDVLDRLKTVKRDPRLPIDPSFPLNKISLEVVKDTVMAMAYSPDGNILSKTGVGAYTYATGVRPHAVVSVENADGRIPTSTLATTFNALDRIQTIRDGATGLSMEFDYGPDIQRWVTKLKSHGQDSITTVYAGNYEKISCNGLTREFYYLDGGIIVVKQNGVFRPFISFTDYQGSILSMFDKDGANVFKASYDAWGQQSVTVNTIGLRRGYTGHEMLPEFGIINMNGRLYDPVLGRFFSPDPFVQMPGSPQGFNRYSYCLNNPLKYTDPSGHAIWGAVIQSLFFSVTNMFSAAITGGNIWKAGVMGLLSSAASFGIGELFSKVIKTGVGTIGKGILKAGTHGAASGVLNMLGGEKFGAGFVSGAISSFAGQLIGSNPSLFCRVSVTSLAGGVTAWACGGDFVKGALRGLAIAIFNEEWHVKYWIKPNGELVGEFQKPLEVKYRVPELDPKIFNVISNTNGIVNCIAIGLKESKQSTFGNNWKVYLCDENSRPFYGNQYVSTINMKDAGEYLNHYTKTFGPIGKVLNGAKLLDGGLKDYNTYQKTGETNYYNTVKATADIAGGWAGAALGAKAGIAIGSFFGGVGFIPGAVLGAAVGAFIGSCLGSSFGEQTVDYVYNQL